MTRLQLLPIIETLVDTRTHQDRAWWFLACPIRILLQYDFTLRNRMRHAGFLPALDYLDAVSVFLNANRRRGAFAALEAAGEAMFHAAVMLDGPDDDPTDV